ncbi:MAG TPA: hypothetical protein PLB38_01900 [bacterium]|nr:hypothetical protein [bacterium]
MKMFFKGFLPALFLSLFFMVNQASAITLHTLKIEASVEPGEQIVENIKLFNDQEKPLVLYPFTEAFKDSGDESGNPTFVPVDPDLNALPNWVIFNSEVYTIQPGEYLEFPVIINIPKNAEPGGHYGVIFFGTVPQSESRKSGVQLGMKIGVLVIIDVAGDAEEDVSLLSFQTKAEQSLFNHLPVTFETRLQNDGNVHVKPSGVITIRNLFGGVAAEIPFNSQDGNLLPETKRKYEDIWFKDLQFYDAGAASDSNQSFFDKLQLEWNNFALGYYKASVKMNVGRQTENYLMADTGFWVFPWRVLTIFILGLILLVLLFKVYNYSVMKKAYQKAKKDLAKESKTKE